MQAWHRALKSINMLVSARLFLGLMGSRFLQGAPAEPIDLRTGAKVKSVPTRAIHRTRHIVVMFLMLMATLTIVMLLSPVSAAGSTTVVTSIAGGSISGYAIKSDGSIWAWGDNTYGEIGNGTTDPYSIPVQVGNLSGFTAVSGGEGFALGLKSDGTVWAWGNDGGGQLGNGTRNNSDVPVQVYGLSGVVDLVAGHDIGYALKSDGSVWDWGEGQTTPIQVNSLSGVTALAGGNGNGYALENNGTVWGWDGTSGTPAVVSGLTGVTAIASGDDDGYALKSDGTVWAWGVNNAGNLGNGSTTYSNVPVQVSGLTGVTTIAAGASGGYALKNDGTEWAWGYNGYEQLGNGSTSNSDVPVQVAFPQTPTVTGISPSGGPQSGGTVVSITGTSFTGATAVHFGSAVGTGLSVDSDTSLTVTSPAGTDTVDVTVTGPGGTSVTNSNDKFTYVTAPTVISLSPNSGPTSGDTVVTVTGTGFTGATAVHFGSAVGTGLSVNSDTSLTVTSPAGTDTVDVTVTGPGGTSVTNSSDKFSYVTAPTVTSLSPKSGPTTGDTVVTVTGTGFTGATAVHFGSAVGTGLSVNSDTSLTVTSPSGAGAVDITVTGPDGISSTNPNDEFTYLAPSTILPSYIPPPSNYQYNTATIRISKAISAVYGEWDASGNPHFYDVTNVVNSVIATGSTGPLGINNGMSGDPLPGTIKIFYIVYNDGATTQTSQLVENDTLYLIPSSLIMPSYIPVPSHYNYNTATIRISKAISAVYGEWDTGGNPHFYDVTNIVNKAIATGSLGINNGMSGDPLYGTIKIFYLVYADGGIIQTIQLVENDTLRFTSIRRYAFAEINGSYGPGFVAEPINTATGAHVLNRTLLTVNGAEPLSFKIHYDSLLLNQGPLGRGWGHNFETRLDVISSVDLAVYWDANRWNSFTSSGGSDFTSPDPAMEGGTLVENADGSYTLTLKDQSTYNFNSSGQLLTQGDGHGL